MTSPGSQAEADHTNTEKKSMSEQDISIFAEISNQYDHLTNAEKKIADYVLSNKGAIQYLSISELAYECHVGDATVSRFCKRLKLQGYNSFKIAIAKSSAHHEALVAASAEDGSQAKGPAVEDSVISVAKSLYGTYTEALNQTMNCLRPDEIRKAVDLLESAGRVYCMGQGGSMIMAQEAAHLMSTISGKFFAVQDSHVQTSTAAIMTPRDVVLFYSYSGSVKDSVDLIKLARSQGAKVILITRFLRSPGARIADIVLQCGSNEQPLQLSSVNAKFAQLFVTDILYQELCIRDPGGTCANQEKIAEALAAKHL